MSHPRILVTGFSVFPGAPVNPTESLVARLRASPPPGIAPENFRAEVLAVEYASIERQLVDICGAFSPDIAIHFGLARECAGFRLERLARNTHAHARPDQAGVLPAASRVCAGPDELASTLPLEEIAYRLQRDGLPVQWSQDAGGYLCNTVMTLSLAHACRGLAPQMSGFVHVPPLLEAEPQTPGAVSLGDLERGAGIIVAACLDAWLSRTGSRS